MYVHRQDSCLMGQYKETLPGRLILLVMASPGGSSKGACCGLASAAGPPPTVWETQPPFSAETNSIGPSAVAAAPRHAVQCLGIVILDMSEIGLTTVCPTNGHVMGKTSKTYYDNPLELVVPYLQINPLGCLRGGAKGRWGHIPQQLFALILFQYRTFPSPRCLSISCIDFTSYVDFPHWPLHHFLRFCCCNIRTSRHQQLLARISSQYLNPTHPVP